MKSFLKESVADWIILTGLFLIASMTFGACVYPLVQYWTIRQQRIQSKYKRRWTTCETCGCIRQRGKVCNNKFGCGATEV